MITLYILIVVRANTQRLAGGRRHLSFDETQPWAPAGFFPGVGKLGVWGRKSPRVQGGSPGEGLGRSLHKPGAQPRLKN